MNRYIKYYKNVVSAQHCEEMMNLFDRSEDQHEEHNNQLMNFKQINLVKYAQKWGIYTEILSNAFLSVLEQYKRDCQIEIPMMWPEKYGFEEFRLKRYEKDQGEFKLHTDVNDLNSSKRFLAFFLYLNDSGTEDADGGTDFPTLGLTAPRVQGSIIVFPPLWTYPHVGLMPHANRKYIVGSYLHYLEK